MMQCECELFSGACNAYQGDSESGSCDMQATVNTTQSDNIQHKVAVLEHPDIFKEVNIDYRKSMSKPHQLSLHVFCFVGRL